MLGVAPKAEKVGHLIHVWHSVVDRLARLGRAVHDDHWHGWVTSRLAVAALEVSFLNLLVGLVGIPCVSASEPAGSVKLDVRILPMPNKGERGRASSLPGRRPPSCGHS